MDEVSRSELTLACLFLLALLAAFAAAGTSDWMSEQAYQRSWAEANGIELEASP